MRSSVLAVVMFFALASVSFGCPAQRPVAKAVAVTARIAVRAPRAVVRAIVVRRPGIIVRRCR